MELLASSLLLSTIITATTGYPYFGMANGQDKYRLCMKFAGVGSLLKTTMGNCCPTTNKVTYSIDNKIKISTSYCLTEEVEAVTVSPGCAQFYNQSNGILKYSLTQNCIKIAGTSVEISPCSGVTGYVWHNDGVCPAPRSNSQVIKRIEKIVATGTSLHLSLVGGNLKMKSEQTALKFKHYSNEELWTDDDHNCLTLKDSSWPEDFSGLNDKELSLHTDCKGATFEYSTTLGTYKLQHSGYCIYVNGDVLKLKRCSAAAPASGVEEVVEATTTPQTATSTSTTPSQSPSRTSSLTTKRTSTMQGPTTTPQPTPPQPTSITSSRTVSATFSSTARPTSTTQGGRTQPSPSSAVAPSSPPRSRSSTTRFQPNFTPTPPGRSTISPTYSARTTLAPTSSAIMQAKCGTACQGMGLANPGQQCEDYCRSKNLFCSTKIQTGNSDLVFTSFGVDCVNDPSMLKWKNAYEPAYYTSTHICAGFMDVSETVECNVEGFNDTGIRRLCRCLQTDDEDDFSPWTPWSSCPVSCNGGIQTRTRICNADSCIGQNKQTQHCNLHPCPVHGGFTEWSQWSRCTVACGGGTRTKSRTCTNPAPAHGGLDCFGPKNYSDVCNPSFCPIDGGWTHWTEWSACNKPCNNGKYNRWRYCTDPMPLYDGNPCYGNSTEAVSCNQKKCPAESVVVRSLRLDLLWVTGMQNPASIAFADFYGLLQKNLRAVFEYSEVNSTYDFCAIKDLRPGSVVATFTLYFNGLDSFQLLLLQDSIEIDKYIGKLKIFGSNSTYNTTIVPSSPPLNFTLIPLTPTSIKAEWKEVPKEKQNGNVSGYILFYREKVLVSEPYKSLATTHLNATVLGLSVFTEYVFRVLSYNENGNGLASEEKTEFTAETAPSQPPTALTANATSGFTIQVDWQHIPPEAWNGRPGGSIVSFDDLKGHSGNVSITFPQNFALLNNLIPLTTYVISVCEYTSPGIGPCQRTMDTTLASPPTKAPGSISITSYINHNTLQVSWSPIAKEDIHGDLKGYKIIYTLTKIGSETQMATPAIEVVHPSLTSITLIKLQPNSMYSIEVLAFNDEGDGVKSSPYDGYTCACPPKIFTNFAASAPYISRDKSGKMIGLFVDILNNITTFSCGRCAQQSVLDFISNGKNGFAEKNSLAEMKNDIDDFVHLSFPVFGSTELETYNSYAFVSVFPHPGVVTFIIKESLTHQVNGMILSVFNTWPIFLVNVLFIILTGFGIWVLDRRTNPDEFPKSCTSGVCSGMYWAFITMGTHGYGDLTPRSIAARLFAIVWILIGLVNLAIFTGALTTAITVAQVYNDPKIYGVEVAAVNDSVAYKVGIFRNAKVNTKFQYKSTEEVAAALKRRDVRGALVDVFSAATRSDLFKHPDIVPKKLIKYPRSFGFVLSGDMNNAASNFRDYLRVHSDDILKTIEKRTAGLEVNEITTGTVSMFSPNSPFLRKTLMITGIILAVAFAVFSMLDFFKRMRRRKDTHSEPFPALKQIESLCDDQLAKLTESFERIGAKLDTHLQERVNYFKTGKIERLKYAKDDDTSSLNARSRLIEQPPEESPEEQRDLCSRTTCDTLINEPSKSYLGQKMSLQSLSCDSEKLNRKT